MSSYTINSIDDQGNANITVVIGSNSYIQQLCGLPLDPTQLQATLTSYVQEYEAALNTVATSPASVAALVDQTQVVT